MSDFKIAYSESFAKSYSRLPLQIQDKVRRFCDKLLADPYSPGINFEKIDACADSKLCSVRIDVAYRAIVVRQKGTGAYLLVWVDSHDEAYRWAMNRRCEVNPETGAIQVYEDMPAPDPGACDPSRSLFAWVKDRDLLRLGVPAPLLGFVRGISSREEFLGAEDALPFDAYENLSWLVDGFPVGEVLELADYNRKKAAVDTEDLSEALELPATLRSFAVVEGEEDLMRVMDAPLETWRVFLHPAQREMAEKDFPGPARVLGGAGTGKTVVAMHRARYLASKCTGKEKVFFTTYTLNLADDIRENLKKICTPEETGRIEVLALDAWVEKCLKEAGVADRVLYGDEAKALWEEAVTLSGTALPYDAPFFSGEWREVAVPAGALTAEDYLSVPRPGRGGRLGKRQRAAVWAVFESYISVCDRERVRDRDRAYLEATEMLKREGSLRYKSVIVDEGQDFGDDAYRLIRAMAGDERENDIFVVGDPRQKIYAARPNLKRCGIDTGGRGGTLRINYRTTDEIRKAADGVLSGTASDETEDGEGGEGCLSLTHGESPLVRNFPTVDDEFAFVLGEVRALSEGGVPLKEMCVVARTKKFVKEFKDRFSKAGIRTYEIEHRDDRSDEGLRVATMHRVKGLEFGHVFLVAVNFGTVPNYAVTNVADPVKHAEAVASERRLLHVAMTRARTGVYITSHGKPSEFLSGARPSETKTDGASRDDT